MIPEGVYLGNHTLQPASVRASPASECAQQAEAPPVGKAFGFVDSLKLAESKFRLLGALGGKSSQTKQTAALPDVVSDLSFDFETGAFAFSDVANAKNYNIRIFEANPSDESADMPVAARRVRDSEGAEKYEGVVDLSELHPGESYKAYVYTYAKDAGGDLVFVMTEPLTGVYKTPYSPSDGTGVVAYKDAGGVTVDFGNDFFTEEYLDKAPTYLVTLYKDGQQVEQIELTAEQVVSVEVQEESSSGDPEISIKSSASIHFSEEGDSVTVQVISKDATAYYDSQVSAPIAVLDEAPAAEVTETADEATSGGEGGEAGSGG